jgi:type I restriction enzyme S subunit
MNGTTFQLHPLSDLLEVDKIQVNKGEPEYSKLKFIGLENIESHTKRYLPEFVSNPEGTCHRFTKDHILYGKLRPYLNKVFLPKFNGKCSTEIIPLKPKNGYSREYVSMILQHQSFIAEAVKHSTGGRMPRADLRHLLRLRVNVPEAKEANAIGDNLQTKLAHIEAIRQAALIQEEATSALQSAIFRKSLPWKPNEPLPNGWKWERLENLKENIQYGISLGKQNKETGIKLVRITDIQNGNIDWDNVPDCDCKDEDFTKYEIKNGDILFARTGATTGKSVLVENPEHAVFASYLIRVQCNREKILPNFLALYFQSQSYWSQIEEGARGGTLEGFNATMLSGLLIPYPVEKSEQNNVVNSVKEKAAGINRLQTLAQIQLLTVEKLPSATLREVFKFEATDK